MHDLETLIKDLMGFAQNRLEFERPPKLFLKHDIENAKNFFGKTAFYDPKNESVTLFVTNRHPKDILRSLAHELVHHSQNLKGELTPEKCGDLGPGYAQENPHMREMERQAFEKGNLCFRDWEDGYKKQLQEVKFLKESKNMATKRLTKGKLKTLIKKILSEQMSIAPGEDAVSRIQDEDELEGLPNQSIDPMPRFRPSPEIPVSGLETLETDLRSPEARKKEASQMRNLKRAGFKNLQQLQKHVGAPTTGIYDDATLAAIKKMQRRFGLVGKQVDGIFGRGTKRAEAKYNDIRVGPDAIASDVVVKPPRPAKDSRDDDTLLDIYADAGVNPEFIKTDRTAELTFRDGFVKDPLASEEENADRYMAYRNRLDAKELGFEDDETMVAPTPKINVRESKEKIKELEKRIKERTKRLEAIKAHEQTPSKKRQISANERTLAKDKQALEKLKKEMSEMNEIAQRGDVADKRKRSSQQGSKKEKGRQVLDEKEVDEQMTSPDAPMSVSAKPDFPDVDGDGDTKEPISKASKEKKEKEGGKSEKTDKDMSKVPPQLRKHVEKKKKGQNESKIYTPEQEQSLYESRFSNRNQQIFDKLKKLWTK